MSPDGKIFKKQWNCYEFENGKIYSLNAVKKSLFESKASFKSVVEDLNTMRVANIDRPHTNLYYILLRIWTIGFDGISLKKMILKGCTLNLIFFAFFVFFPLQAIKFNKK